MVGTFFLGITGWLYYQTMSTTYGLMNILDAPPLVHEVNRLGEALMVLSSILVFWAYGSTSFVTKNKSQRKWGLSLLIQWRKRLPHPFIYGLFSDPLES